MRKRLAEMTQHWRQIRELVPYLQPLRGGISKECQYFPPSSIEKVRCQRIVEEVQQSDAGVDLFNPFVQESDI